MKTALFFLMSLAITTSSQAFWKQLSSDEELEQEVHILPVKILSLEENITTCPYPVTEGHMTEEQKKQFNARLRSYGPVRKILEIGLNAGHSAENFFTNCPDLKTFVSVDICHHPYTPYAIRFFQEKYNKRFISLEGDSLLKVPEFAYNNPHVKFDLIFIDGNHSFDYCLHDILNCGKIAHESTYLWIDDYNDPSVAAAVDTAVIRGIIAIDAIHEDRTENRSWVEAHYLL